MEARILPKAVHAFSCLDNLPEPTVQVAERFTAYERAKACSRLEWRVLVLDRRWEAAFFINKEQLAQ